MKTRVIQSEPDLAEPQRPAEQPQPQQQTKHHLAARMARWSAQHRKIAILGWLACAALLFAVSLAAPMKKIDTDTTGPGESGRADKILATSFKQPAGESILIQSRSLAAGEAKFDAAVKAAVAAVSRLDAVKNVRSPFAAGNDGQISGDGHAALVEFQIRGDSANAVDKIDPVVAAVAKVQTAHPQVFVGQFGDASADKEINAAFMDDLKKAGFFSVPITIIILVLAFGALVAAGIPLLLGLSAVLAATGLVALVSNLSPMADSVSAIILLVGLAVGVDYSLFYLKREREERAAGRSEEAALEAAAATSGRSVLISGLTVIVAMAGMFLAGNEGFTSFGIATILVVAVAMLGSLTVLPAVLSKLGDKVDRGRVPLIHRLRRDDGEGRIWGAIVDCVLRRPALSAVLACGLLVAIAVPALQLHTAEPGPETYPESLAVMKTYNRLQQTFPGTEIPANVVVQAANVESPQMKEAISQLKWQALATNQMHEPILVDVNGAKTVANIAIPVNGEGTDRESNEALTALRTLLPGTVSAVPGTTVAVTGATQSSKDFNDQMKSVAPLVFGFVLVLAFALLLVSFRSIVIAVKAILLNLLSVAAAYGILVLVFQHGWGKGLLGFDRTSGIDPFLPILLFVLLFGLSMDYHVFIVSRIREAYDRGMSTDEAVAHGIKSTAGVVTSAAIVMVFVFAIFGTLSMMIFKQFGVGLAAAILIDATIIRAVLLPATMKLLGDWNWYLPKWLEWLPHLEHGERVKPVEAPAVPARMA
jgi:uncharacterized membrane protein YdfJ with MMPL/SSD domain